MAATTATTQQPPSDDSRELVLATLAAHSASLLATARRYSLCADDAHDAFQRAMEIFLRRAGDLDPVAAPAWLRTVVKHEALAVRAARRRIVGPAEFDADRTEAREALPVEERLASVERRDRSAEALARLKPQEVRALVLKARGYSYKEIAEITGWTYTKVNRCITEGRRAFLDRYAEIEAGRECDRWAPALSALADGEAGPQDVAALRPHLRHCAACRARLREFRAAPPAVAALVPVAVLDHAPALAGEEGGGAGLLMRMYEAVAGGLHERAVLSAHKVQAGVEAMSAGKLAAVAASATALAGGGAAALREADDRAAASPAAAAAAAAERDAAPARESQGPDGSDAIRDAIAPPADSRPQVTEPAAAPPSSRSQKRTPDVRRAALPAEFDPAPASPPAGAASQPPSPAGGPDRGSGAASATAPAGPARSRSPSRPTTTAPDTTRAEFGP